MGKFETRSGRVRIVNEGRNVRESETTLASPCGVPFSFEVTIGESGTTKRLVRSFEVTGADPNTGSVKTCKYSLHDREHKSYINLFEKLARDFGLRLPLNRRPRAKKEFRAAFQPLLTDNLAPGILYGYGDPAVLLVEQGLAAADRWYYLLVTSNDAPDSFPILRSRNLVDWEFVSFVFPRGRKPEWAADGEYTSDYWAPEMHKVGNEFRVYFVARDKETHALCIGMATALRPEGPFSAGKEPILQGNVIDPHVFVDDDESAFLYWKTDNNGVWPRRLSDLLYKHPHLITEMFTQKEDQITASLIQTLWPWTRTLEHMEAFFVQHILIEAVTSMFSAFYNRLERLFNAQNDARVQNDIRAVLEVIRTPMYAQKMLPDGVSLVGERIKVIENDQAWEAHLVEGMWVAKHLGKYYLFYAGNDFSTDLYGIGVAIADSPMGPFHKIPGPFLSSTDEWSGPGHPSVVIGPDGESQLFLHAYFPGRTGYKEFRVLLTIPIAFENERVLLR